MIAILFVYLLNLITSGCFEDVIERMVAAELRSRKWAKENPAD